MIVGLVAAFITLFLAHNCQAVSLAVARGYLAGSCTGTAAEQIPYDFGDVCQNTFGQYDQSHKFDCATRTLFHYNASDCRTENVFFSYAECSVSPEGDRASDYACSDYPADQLVMVESGAGCNGADIVNRTSVNVFLLGCVGIDRSYTSVTATGDALRVATFRKAGCKPEDKVTEQVVALDQCTTSFLAAPDQQFFRGKGVAARRVRSASYPGPLLNRFVAACLILITTALMMG